MDTEEELLLIVVALACIKKKRRCRRLKKRTWCRPRKLLFGGNLLGEMKLETSDWYNCLRMTEDNYRHLLSLVSPLIERRDTCRPMHKSITPHERLTLTLRFLSTGRSYTDLQDSTGISASAMSSIVPETCKAIYAVLRKTYFKFPSSEQEWRNIGKEFEDRWNFPHCLGALGGKHVQIIPPADRGSFYYNHKGCHSLVLMAVSNANYEFLLCDIGTNGCVSGGEVLDYTLFCDKLDSCTLKIPAAEKMSNSDIDLPFVFVSDEAFALRKDLMMPFSQEDLTSEHSVFNYRLCRAHSVLENLFGILVTRFRIFNTKINMKPSNINSVVMACCVLHNFLRKTSPDHYTPPECFDQNDAEFEFGTSALGLRTRECNLLNLDREDSLGAEQDAERVRESFCDYFNNEGRIEWQNRMNV